MYKCKFCGSTNVSHAMWVNPNTDEPIETFGSWNEEYTSHCNSCHRAACIVIADECDLCNGAGILFSPTNDQAQKVADTEAFSLPPTVEKCGKCNVFKTDDDALAAVRRAWDHNRETVYQEIVYQEVVEEVGDQEMPSIDDHCECAEHELVEGVRWPVKLDFDSSKAWVSTCGSCAPHDDDVGAAVRLLFDMAEEKLLTDKDLSVGFATPAGHRDCLHPYIKGIAPEDAAAFVRIVLAARAEAKKGSVS